MAVAHLTLFGKFDIRLADGSLLDLPGQKDRALLAILALSSGAALSRDKLTGLLWSDRADTQARDSLKHALKHIRQVLSDAVPEEASEGLVTTDRHEIRLAPDWISVDVVAFEALVPRGTPEALEEANRLCAGELLEGIAVHDVGFKSWLLAERQRLRRLQEQALAKLLAPALDTEIRERAALKLLELDPTREAAACVLMQVHVQRGESAQAVKLFETLCERLQIDLGVKPEQETLEIYEAIRSGRLRAPDTRSVSILNPKLTRHAGGEPDLLGKPAIAVLPFENMSGDPEQNYFAEGIAEDIITELSRFNQLHVVARNSSFRSRQDVDIIRAGRELGVEYLVEGSVRRLGDRIRITAQLIDAKSGKHLWAERFDRNEKDLFAVQDQLVRTIVATLVGRILATDLELAKRKPPANLEAYECVLRGDALPIGHPEPEAEARRLFERAIELDPGYARAYASLAHHLSLKWLRELSGTDDDLDQGLELAQKAVALDENDSECHNALGWIHLHRKSHELAEYHYRKAFELNRNRAPQIAERAILYIFLGMPAEALNCFQDAKLIDPYFEPDWYWRNVGLAHFVARRYEEAIANFGRSAKMPFWERAYLAASYAQTDKRDLAKQQAAETVRLAPNFSLVRFAEMEPYKHATDRQHLVDALRKAGLPE